jgi:hypothetical protein
VVDGLCHRNRLRLLARIALVLPILLGGFLGLAIWVRGPILILLTLIILTRTILFSFLGNEARYIVECYPFVIAGCGVTIAVLGRYAKMIGSRLGLLGSVY